MMFYALSGGVVVWVNIELKKMYQITSPEGLNVKWHFYPLDAELSSERLDDVTVIVRVACLLHNFNSLLLKDFT